MKKLLFLCLILQSLFAFSQSPEGSQLAVINFKTYGDVDGIRLDSLDAQYAQFYTWRGESVTFDYGQSGSRKKMAVTDNKGVPLIFARLNSVCPKTI